MKNSRSTFRRAGSLADMAAFPATGAPSLNGHPDEHEAVSAAFRRFQARHGGGGTRRLSPLARANALRDAGLA